MHLLRQITALVLRHTNRNTLLHPERFRSIDTERLPLGCYALNRRNYRAFKFAFWQGVEESQVCAEFVQFRREVLFAESGHAVLVCVVGQEGEDVDGFLLGCFGDVGG